MLGHMVALKLNILRNCFPKRLDFCRFVVSFEIKKYKFYSLVRIQDCFGYFGSLAFPCEFGDQFINFCRKAAGILIAFALNL